MTEEQIRDVVLHILGQIAPEADLTALRPEKRLRDQFELDSVDYLSFATALQKEFGIHIPEEDCLSLATLNGCLAYLLSKGCSVTSATTPG